MRASSAWRAIGDQLGHSYWEVFFSRRGSSGGESGRAAPRRLEPGESSRSSDCPTPVSTELEWLTVTATGRATGCAGLPSAAGAAEAPGDALVAVSSGMLPPRGASGARSALARGGEVAVLSGGPSDAARFSGGALGRAGGGRRGSEPPFSLAARAGCSQATLARRFAPGSVAADRPDVLRLRCLESGGRRSSGRRRLSLCRPARLLMVGRM